MPAGLAPAVFTRFAKPVRVLPRTVEADPQVRVCSRASRVR